VGDFARHHEIRYRGAVDVASGGALLVEESFPAGLALWAGGWLLLTGALSGQEDQEKSKTERQTLHIQTLIKQLDDEARWMSASKQLRQTGRPAVKPLLATIQSDDEGVLDTPLIRRALLTLGSMGPVAAGAYSDLYEAAKQCDPKIYIAVLHTLGDLVPYSDQQGNSAAENALVMSTLGTIRTMSRQERTSWSRELGRFKSRLMVDPDAGLEAMIGEVKSNRMHRREVAAEVLGTMGKDAERAIPALADAVSALRDVHFNQGPNQDEFIQDAAETMIRIAPNDARCAVAYSYRLMQAPTEAERSEAALRIGAFGKAAKSEVHTLIASTATNHQPSQRVRCESITALGMIGADAKEAIPALERLCNSEDQAIAVRARAALRQIRRR